MESSRAGVIRIKDAKNITVENWGNSRYGTNGISELKIRNVP